MRYPKLLCRGDAIGVCAPSSGVPEGLYPRLDKAVSNVRAQGYRVIETQSVRSQSKCVSADSKTRAREFTSLYENPDVAAIIPPWGGEFLMDMLPYLDFDRISSMSPKWVCGYSDLTTLTFPLTLICDIATIHGSNFINMGFAEIDGYDLKAFEVMSERETVQRSSEYWGGYSQSSDSRKDGYVLDKETCLKSLGGEEKLAFEGVMVGGCMDVLCKLIGTRFAPIDGFIERYGRRGIIWALESCEMNAADIYRTFWQMRECGWFDRCAGIILGRPDGYSDTRDFTFADAMRQGLGDLNVPVIYGADIGHLPPQIQIVNGSYGIVEYNFGAAVFRQRPL